MGESAFLIGVATVIAGFVGWRLGKRVQRAAGRAARRRLPADYLAGLNYVINEQPDRALEVFTRMVDVNTETVEIHFALGSLFRRRGEVDRAIRIHQGILDRPQLEPVQREQALLELAVDYLRAGLLDRSEELYLKLTETRLHRLTALRALIGIYEQQHDWTQAISVHRELRSSGGFVQPSAIAHYHCELAEIARSSGRGEEARRFLREARREQRRFPRAAILRAEIARDAGEDTLASRLLLLALEREPALLLEVLPRLQACGQRMQTQEPLNTAILALQRGRRPAHEVASALILTDVFEEPSALSAVREYVLSDGLLRELAQPLDVSTGLDDDTLRRVARLLGRVLGRSARYRCDECGFASHAWFWQCPGCKSWDSMRPQLGAAGELAAGAAVTH
ncbi:MAG TPA: tetratricopeptide repeat protein [Steroidobacteraceae bacterium]|nr:tetratricopeptide repeat protein [Steroidobacteraceae bacterium]